MASESAELHTSSSNNSQYAPIKDIANRVPMCPFASIYYREHTLRPNHIIVEEHQLDDERWSRQAFALGIPFADVHSPCPEARRFAQKLQKKQRISGKRLTELLLPLIQWASKSSKRLQVKTETAFHDEAVPDGSMDQADDCVWSMPLPLPRPNIVVGYSQGNFNSHELELQDGIIANGRGEPCDLSRISQPTSGVFWPFFVVEVQQESSRAAQNAAAGSASTCNNSLALLAEAADEPAIQRQGRNIFWQTQRSIQSFSLSISGKIATLHLNNSDGGLRHRCTAIRSYNLDDEREVCALVARLGSIFVWAENSRLQAVHNMLENLSSLVRLDARDMVSDAFPNEHLDAVTANSRPVSPRKMLTGIRSVWAEISPKWIRAQG